jgi:hypothetical protein
VQPTDLNTVDNDRRGTRLCVAPQCRRYPAAGYSGARRAPPGLALCGTCRGRLAARLAGLPELYTELEGTLAHTRNDAERVRGRGQPGIPLNLRAVDARTKIHGTLAAWADLVVHGRNTTPPARTVPALAGFLGRHVDWLAAHPAAGDAAAEIGDLMGAGGHATRAPARHIRVGPCIDSRCSGTLAALFHDHAGRTPSAIVCDADNAHAWPPERWHTLRRLLHPGGPTAAGGVTAADISATWSIPANTVYGLARVHQWRRHRRSQRVYYNTDDVARTLDRQ